MPQNNGGVNNRRKRALDRLVVNLNEAETTLETRKNMLKNGSKHVPIQSQQDFIEVDEKNVSRMKKEVETLKSRIKY